jgi:hypothetical protein
MVETRPGLSLMHQNTSSDGRLAVESMGGGVEVGVLRVCTLHVARYSEAKALTHCANQTTKVVRRTEWMERAFF